MEHAEEVLREVVGWLVIVVEAFGAAVIIVGAVWGFVQFLLIAVRRHDMNAFLRVRLTVGRFLVLGLEFQLAGDVLRTAVAPGFEELGQLAAIAAIRTVLNIFLMREIAAERREVEQEPTSGAVRGGAS